MQKVINVLLTIGYSIVLLDVFVGATIFCLMIGGAMKFAGPPGFLFIGLIIGVFFGFAAVILSAIERYHTWT